MRVLVGCKRGSNGSLRDKWGHCLCIACAEFNRTRQRRNPRIDYKREWSRKNRDKIASYVKKWIAANPEKRKAVIKSWRDRNPDKVKAMSARAGKKWARNNRGKRNATVKARQLAQRSRTPSWANRSELEWFYTEAQRLTDQTGTPHEVDHVIPLQGKNVSGLHVPWNLQILTRFANRSKRNGVALSA